MQRQHGTQKLDGQEPGGAKEKTNSSGGVVVNPMANPEGHNSVQLSPTAVGVVPDGMTGEQEDVGRVATAAGGDPRSHAGNGAVRNGEGQMQTEVVLSAGSDFGRELVGDNPEEDDTTTASAAMLAPTTSIPWDNTTGVEQQQDPLFPSRGVDKEGTAERGRISKKRPRECSEANDIQLSTSSPRGGRLGARADRPPFIRGTGRSRGRGRGDGGGYSVVSDGPLIGLLVLPGQDDGELGPEASQTRVRSSSPNEGGDNSQANLAGEPEGNRFRTQEGGAIASPSRGYLGLGRDVGRRDAIKPSEDPEIDEVVSQDLATREIRRVRRKESDQSGRDHQFMDRKGEEGGGGHGAQPDAKDDGQTTPAATGGDTVSELVTVNGTATLAQQQHANGKGGGFQGRGGEGGGRGEAGKEGSRNESSSSTTNASNVRCDIGNGDKSRGGGGNSNTDMVDVPGRESQSNGVMFAATTSSGAALTEPPEETKSENSRTAAAAVAAAEGTSATASKGPSIAPVPPHRAREDKPGREATGSGGAAEGASGAKSTVKETIAGKIGQAGPMEVAKEEAEEKEEQLKEKAEAGIAEAEVEAEAAPRARECPEHALPVARTFFDFSTVSNFEIRMLPEFFTGRSASKTPEMYMQSRNYMVRAYQRMLEAERDGQAFLTGTECRRKLAGDVCSILRIHDFLDRFGLINTRTGGKRPPSYPPVPPTTYHLWMPASSASAAVESPSAGATGATGGPSGRRRDGGVGRREATWAGGVAAAARGGGGAMGGYAGVAGVGEGVDIAAARSSESGGGYEEWDKKEMIRLMEAALASPDQWDVVAQQVGGGHSPAACMRRFLNLAVEEAFEEEGAEEQSSNSGGAVVADSASKSPAQSESASTDAALASPGATAVPSMTATPVPSTGNAGTPNTASSLGENIGSEPAASAITPPPTGTATPAASPTLKTSLATPGGVSVDAVGSRRVGGSGIGSGASINRAAGAYGVIGHRGKTRPAHLGPAAPALMLASALVSGVHPEVLEAAMTAATAAADDVSRRFARVWSSGPNISNESRGPLSATQQRVAGRSSDGDVGKGTGTGNDDNDNEHEAGRRREDDAGADADADVEMRDAAPLTAVARGCTTSPTHGHQKQVSKINCGREGAVDGETPTEAMNREPGSRCTALRKDGGWVGSGEGAAGEVLVERQAARSGAARATVLSAAGLQARGLAEIEERRTEALMSDLLEARVQRLETKLHCLDELDKVLETERLSLEHDRAEMLADQARSMLSR